MSRLRGQSACCLSADRRAYVTPRPERQPPLKGRPAASGILFDLRRREIEGCGHAGQRHLDFDLGGVDLAWLVEPKGDRSWPEDHDHHKDDLQEYPGNRA